MSFHALMPVYQSHKKVRGLKITQIDTRDDGSAVLHFPGDYPKLPVPSEYMAKHQPQVGGYYVVYEDGYVSWSPGETFESGYTRVRS